MEYEYYRGYEKFIKKMNLTDRPSVLRKCRSPNKRKKSDDVSRSVEGSGVQGSSSLIN